MGAATGGRRLEGGERPEVVVVFRCLSEGLGVLPPTVTVYVNVISRCRLSARPLGV